MTNYFKCPICSLEGCYSSYYDYAFKRMVSDFSCDATPNHHFLIVELPPIKIIDPSQFCTESEEAEEK